MLNKRVIVLALVFMVIATGICFAAPVRGAIVASGNGWTIYQNNSAQAVTLSGGNGSTWFEVVRKVATQAYELRCSDGVVRVVENVGMLADIVSKFKIFPPASTAAEITSAVSQVWSTVCKF